MARTPEIPRVTFTWSPEGRVLVAYDDVTFKQARARFKREFPQHARYMGEVRVEECECSGTGCIQTATAGAVYEDDLAEYDPCICRGKVRM